VPLVSVVVIGYNDSANLPTALRSVQRQTFQDLEVVVVDDASTDATPDIADRFARADRRMRVIRLDHNSGGCSRPRNVGMAAATGRYLLFLDSDDELPRRAAARLVAAAERTGADLTCGRYVRRHHHPRRLITSNDDLYLRPAYVRSIAERPRQLYDTPAWNKLYRRTLVEGNGLHFPEGLLYEDLLFTTEAYCAASGIAIVPDVVYIWHVRRQSLTLSITTRGGVRNWQDRFEVHRRIDEFLAGHAVGRELVEAKQRKFVDVDLTLFLRELRQSPPDERAELLDIARRYLEPLDPAELPAPAPAVRMAVHAIRRGDLAGTLVAADWATTGGAGGDFDAYRDVIGDAVTGSAPLTTVRRVRVEGSTVTIDGDIAPLPSVAAAPEHAALELRGRMGGLLATVPVTLDLGDRIRFHAELDLARLGPRLVTPRAGPEVRFVMRLHRGGRTTALTLTARDADLPDADVPVPTPWRALTGERIRFRESNGRFVAQLSALPARFDRAVYLATRARNGALRARARWERRVSR
jgi:glycosyltransferase involved in cell wall biosynthesis